VGEIPLRDPKLRRGYYFPSFLEPRRRAEKALVAVIQTAFVEGVSTRRIDQLVQSLGLEGIDKSRVSRICRELDEEERSSSWPVLIQRPSASGDSRMRAF
jgi:putative transposase